MRRRRTDATGSVRAERPSDRELLARFLHYLRPYARPLLGALALVPFMVGAELAQPWLLKVGIDEYIVARHGEGLWVPAAGLLFVVGLGYVLSAAHNYGLQWSVVRALADLRRAIYRHVMEQGMAFFDRHPSGALLTRTTSDVESLGETVTMGMMTMFADLLKIAGIVAVMLWMDVRLTLLTFAASPVLVVIVDVYRRGLRRFSTRIRKALSRLNAYLAESLNGLDVIRAFGREELSGEEFRRLNFQYLDAYRKSNWLDASLYAIVDGVTSATIALMLWFGGARHIGGESAVTLGLLVAFIEYISRVYVPIRELSGKFATLQRAAAAMERIVRLLDDAEPISPGRSEYRDRVFEGHVVFEDVWFAYRQGDDVLRGISFELRPGKTVALVGATGSGKTTVGKLLGRMYDGYRGSIRLDGIELRDIPPETVRRTVVAVQQDVYLFNGTVVDNIALCSGVSRERAIEAARMVHASHFIERLPGGYDAQVAERGANLSAGQAQLLAFARAMACDAPVLILDEATASVDSATEVLIQRAIRAILARKTVLIVAHRLSTVQQADEILVMDRGCIVERGTHEELLARGGRYALLYRQRFAA